MISMSTCSQNRIVMSRLSLCLQQPLWTKIVHQWTIFIFYLHSLCPPNISLPLFNHYLFIYLLFNVQNAKVFFSFFLSVLVSFFLLLRHRFILLLWCRQLIYCFLLQVIMDVMYACMHALHGWQNGGANNFKLVLCLICELFKMYPKIYHTFIIEVCASTIGEIIHGSC